VEFLEQVYLFAKELYSNIDKRDFGGDVLLCPLGRTHRKKRDESGTDIIRQTDRPKGSDTQMVRPYSNPDI
jgi:hypothetical protein